jgi:uncharacterized protein
MDAAGAYDASAINVLRTCFHHGKGADEDDKNGVELYRSVTERGHAGAGRNLSICFENGTGVDVDKAKAAELYLRASKSGDPFAIYNVGCLYDHGNGVCKNIAQAVELYGRAVESGIPGVPKRMFSVMTEMALCRTRQTEASGDTRPLL